MSKELTKQSQAIIDMFKPYTYKEGNSWWAVYDEDFLFGAKEKQFETKGGAELFIKEYWKKKNAESKTVTA